MVAVQDRGHSDFRHRGGACGQTANWHPFLPHGYSGHADGRGHRVFHVHRLRFGLDGGGECRNPQRDLPLGIITTLLVCAALYISVALVLTGIANWKTLDSAWPRSRTL